MLGGIALVTDEDGRRLLLLDVLRGDRSLFIQREELAAAWGIVTPALNQIETERIQPQIYPYGSAGPAVPGFQEGQHCGS